MTVNSFATLPTKIQKQRQKQWEALKEQGNLTSLTSVTNSLLPDRKLAGRNLNKKLTYMLLLFQYQETCSRWSYKMLRLNLHERKSWSTSTLPSLILEGGFNNKFSFYNSLYLASTVIFRCSTFLGILWIGRICKILHLQVFLKRSMVSWLNLQRLWLPWFPSFLHNW